MSMRSADSALTARPLVPLWPTPLGVHHWASAQEIHPLLVRVPGSLRAYAAA